MITKEQLRENGFSQYNAWDSIMEKKIENPLGHSMLVFIFDDHCAIQFHYFSYPPSTSGSIHKHTTVYSIDEVNETFDLFCKMVS